MVPPAPSPPRAPGPEPGSSPRPFPFLVVCLVATLFFAALGSKMGAARLWHHDETLTGERAWEMLVSGDPWGVRLNGKPNFHKPPLQYWFTAALLRGFPGQPEVAVRLPAALAATLCLLATAALGRVAWPEDPLAGPAAALALAGCGFWVQSSRMGMLDVGAALGVTATLLGGEVARRRGDPRGWWLAGAGAVFGAWQKAPYALGVWVVSLLGRVRSAELAREPRRWPRTLRRAVLAAGVLILVWPLLQVVRFGWAAVLQGQSVSTGNLLNANKSLGFQPWLYLWWLVRDWGAFGLLTPVAVGAAFRGGADRRDPFRAEAAVAVVLGWGVVACLPYRTERYLVFLLPLAALLVVRLLRQDATGRPRRYGGTLLGLALLSTVPVVSFHYLRSFPDREDLRAAARDYGTAVAADPAAVAVVNRSLESGINVPVFTLFYGELRRPVFVFEGWTQSALVRLDQAGPGAHFLGLSETGRTGPFAPAREIARHDRWVVWEAAP